MNKILKNLIKITGVVACAVVLFFNVSLTGNNNSENIDLISLFAVNEANAECVPPHPTSPSGKCLWLSQRCIFAVGYRECDPYK